MSAQAPPKSLISSTSFRRHSDPKAPRSRLFLWKTKYRGPPRVRLYTSSTNGARQECIPAFLYSPKHAVLALFVGLRTGAFCDFMDFFKHGKSARGGHF